MDFVYYFFAPGLDSDEVKLYYLHFCPDFFAERLPNPQWSSIPPMFGYMTLPYPRSCSCLSLTCAVCLLVNVIRGFGRRTEVRKSSLLVYLNGALIAADYLREMLTLFFSRRSLTNRKLPIIFSSSTVSYLSRVVRLV